MIPAMLRPTLLASLSLLLPAQENWRTPPKPIADLLLAPPPPAVSVSPRARYLLLLEREAMPSLERLARDVVRLAGLRLDPKTRGPQRLSRTTGVRILEIATRVERRLVLAPDADVDGITWNADATRFAFTQTKDDRIELWVADPATGRAEAVPALALAPALGNAVRWLPDQQRLLVLARVERGPAPVEPKVPSGPYVEAADGRKAPVRTYQDLLRDEHDAALLRWLGTSQLAIVDVASKQVQRIGEPALWRGADFSPDGSWLLATEIREPFSYRVPLGSFARRTSILRPDGSLVRHLADLPIEEHVPIGGVPNGPRQLRWLPFADATLMWVEALDDGDPKREVDHRDRILQAEPPFDAPQEWRRVQHRFQSAQFAEAGEFALVTEFDRKHRRARTTQVFQGGRADVVLFDRSTQDAYGDPGRPLTRLDDRGESLLFRAQEHLFLSGDGASPDGDRPFLARFDPATRSTRKVFESRPDRYEEFVAIVDADHDRILIRSESPAEFPNYWLVEAGKPERVALTEMTDPAAGMTAGIRKELLRYARPDGVELSGTLYLPPDHADGKRWPLFVWAYPREFDDPTNAGQVRGSTMRYTRIGGTSALTLLLAGYAVLDNAAMPIVGPVETANDTFVAQLVANAQAAIDACVARGVADPARVAIGGHSYGAFMTANLLAHCDLFRTGVARSGAYNRSLTPFGFQNEERTFWQASEIYHQMSPFSHAHRINEPILLIHGQADNNPGTFPMQSERLFAAIKGNGGRAKLVTLPYESHGYQARESVLHVVAETIDWLDRYVKAAPGSG
jgi:dipeptidyl aminopeptidase/acylaminoacyl peptidase